MGKGSRRLKSKPATSKSEGDMSVVEGHDFGGGESTSVADATGESTVIMDDRIALTPQQAEGLRALYGARKELESRIAFAEQMVGIEGREIVNGDLGDENPYLMLRPLPNGASG